MATASPGTAAGLSPTKCVPQTPAYPADLPRLPEVLLVCLVHDSPRLRAAWPEVQASTLDPLFCALTELQGAARLLVGGVVYRSEPRAELASLLRPSEGTTLIPFAPAARFSVNVTEALRRTPLYGAAQLDAIGMPTSSTESLECALVDAVAAALDLLASRKCAPHLPAFARGALRANHSPVLARHVCQVLALDTHVAVSAESDAPLRLPADASHLGPSVNACSALDHATSHALLQKLGQQGQTFSTVLLGPKNASDASLASAATAAHDPLCAAVSGTEAVPAEQVLGPAWRAPPHVAVKINGRDLAQLLRTRAPAPVPAPPTVAAPRKSSPLKPERVINPPTSAVAPTDPTLTSKLMMLLQQQQTMLQNLAKQQAEARDPPASTARPTLRAHAVEQLRQRLLAQQDALQQQSERLREGQATDLNVIFQALVNIDKEAKEAGLALGGPSSVMRAVKPPLTRTQSQVMATDAPAAASPAAQARSRLAADSPSSPRAQSVWQGLIKWSASGATDSLFCLTVASCGSGVTRQQLALPWPNVLSVSAFVPVDTSRLMRFISTHRTPCALLTLRGYPPSLAMPGSENNEANYGMLAAMLEKHQRAAYVAHGGPGCGLLLVALSGARLPMPQASQAPRLLAMVFKSPIPLAELGTSTSQSTTSARGMIPVAAPSPSPLPAGGIDSFMSLPGTAQAAHPFIPGAMTMASPNMQLAHAAPAPSLHGAAATPSLAGQSPVMPPASAYPPAVPLGMLPMSGTPTAPRPSAQGNANLSSMVSDLLTPDQLRSLGLGGGL